MLTGWRWVPISHQLHSRAAAALLHVRDIAKAAWRKADTGSDARVQLQQDSVSEEVRGLQGRNGDTQGHADHTLSAFSHKEHLSFSFH